MNMIFSDLRFPRPITVDRPDIEPPRPPPKPVEYRPTQPIPLDQAVQRLLDIIENSKGD